MPELAAAITDTLRHGHKLDEPDDDVLVFLKLHAIGPEHLKTLESRRAGPWDVMFNPIRALRPPRISGMKFESLLRPFDPAGFHFNKSFLAKEILWEGELAGKPARLLYNKFPFARLHGLLVPEPVRELPQYLTPELHGWAWDLCAESGVPGLCLGYNSLGAGASVNHLHFQSFVPASPLPMLDGRFAHNGGTQPYPLPCQRFTDPAESLVRTRPAAPAATRPTTSSTARTACTSSPACRRTAASWTPAAAAMAGAKWPAPSPCSAGRRLTV